MTRFAYLFPGQGSQHPGMGRELADAFPECREVFDESDRALQMPLSRMCFEGSREDLALTENTQPAMLTVDVAAWRALEQRGLVPAAAAGHSLGEYAAHVASGSLAFGDAVRTVRARGRFMQEAVPVGRGAMAAILGLDLDAVERICREAADGEIVSAANINGPAQIVIAGHADAVGRAGEAATAAGARRVVRLPVSAPFHCALMRPAADRLRPTLDRLELREASFPVYTNVDASPVQRADDVRDALSRQVASPVRWVQSMERMLADGIETFVEVGPGKVLAGLARGVRRGLRVLSVANPEGVETAAAELR